MSPLDALADQLEEELEGLLDEGETDVRRYAQEIVLRVGEAHTAGGIDGENPSAVIGDAARTCRGPGRATDPALAAHEQQAGAEHTVQRAGFVG